MTTATAHPADITAWSRGELVTRENEGCRLKAFWDPIGKVWTCGYGCTGPEIRDGTIWTQRQADYEFSVRYAGARFGARQDVGPAFFDGVDEARQDALTDMAYELGARGLAKFEKMIAAVRAGDWPDVATEAQASKWSAEVPHRARRIEAMLLSGVFNA